MGAETFVSIWEPLSFADTLPSVDGLFYQPHFVTLEGKSNYINIFNCGHRGQSVMLITEGTYEVFYASGREGMNFSSAVWD